jgi:urease
MSIGRTILGRRHVLPSTWFTARQIQIEGTFPTGTYLVTVVEPIATEAGNIELALYGANLTPPPDNLFPEVNFEDYAPNKAPGYIWCEVIDNPGPYKTDILLNDKEIVNNEQRKRKRLRLKVVNHGTRPIQVRRILLFCYSFFLPLFPCLFFADADARMMVGWISFPLHRDKQRA